MPPGVPGAPPPPPPAHGAASAAASAAAAAAPAAVLMTRLQPRRMTGAEILNRSQVSDSEYGESKAAVSKARANVGDVTI